MSLQGTARETAPTPTRGIRSGGDPRDNRGQQASLDRPRDRWGQVGCCTWKPRHGARHGLILALSSAGAGRRARSAVDSTVCEAFSKSSTSPRGSSTQGDPRPPPRGQHRLAAGELGRGEVPSKRSAAERS